MKKSIIIFCLLPILLLGQESLTINNQIIDLNLVDNQYYIGFNTKISWDARKKILSQTNFGLMKNNVVELNNHLRTNEDPIQTLRAYSEVEFVNPVYTMEGHRLSFKDEMIVKVKSSADINDIIQLEDRFAVYDLVQDELMDRLWTVSVMPGKALELSRNINELDFVEFAEPNFVYLDGVADIPSDPLTQGYGQYAYQNMGKAFMNKDSEFELKYSKINADIKLYPAQSLYRQTPHNQFVRVAVLDDGVDVDHPDLAGKVLSGYDAVRGISYSQENMTTFDGHGTRVAGIIASNHNNGIGSAGVSPDARIVPVKAWDQTGPNSFNMSSANIARGFYWCAFNNVDVINCSFGISSSNVVADAIRTAYLHGRGGKGALIVCSAGNRNRPISSSTYPRGHGMPLVVGASDMFDRRVDRLWDEYDVNWGSNYGNTLDILAPGLYLSTTVRGGDYIYFQGTSCATPVVSGVAAMMIAANPSMSSYQLKQAIIQSVDKVPGISYGEHKFFGSWSEYNGYGRLNAFKALDKAINFYKSIKYCSAYAQNSRSHYIQGIRLNGKTNLSGNNDGYYIQNSTLTTLEKGTTYRLDLLTNFGANPVKQVGVYLDYDLDGMLERVAYESAINRNNGELSYYIYLPTSARTGRAKLRIIYSTRTNAGFVSPSSCGKPIGGEVEDYFVNIKSKEVYCSMSTRDYYSAFFKKVRIYQSGGFNTDRTFDLRADTKLPTSINLFQPLQMDKHTRINLTIDPGYFIRHYAMHYVIWIDSNRDGYFSSWERVVRTATSRSGRVNISGLIPSWVVPGKTMMRVAMSPTNAISSCGYMNYGDAIDIPIEITEPLSIWIIDLLKETNTSVEKENTNLDFDVKRNSTFTSNSFSRPVKSNEELDWSFYPNPACDFIQIKREDSERALLGYLFDTSGRIVLPIRWSAGSSDHKLDVSGLTSGQYFLKIANFNAKVVQVIK